MQDEPILDPSVLTSTMYVSFLSFISNVELPSRPMLQRRVLHTTSAALCRRVSPSSYLHSSGTAVARRCFSKTSLDPSARTVQVLHNKPTTSYVQVEQDIAVMQRRIRDAYQCVCTVDSFSVASPRSHCIVYPSCHAISNVHDNALTLQLRGLPHRSGCWTGVPRSGQGAFRRDPSSVCQHGDQHCSHVQESRPNGRGRRGL